MDSGTHRSAASPESSESARPRRRTDVVFRGTCNEALLYDPRADAVHVLNPTALAVWDLCDGTHTEQGIEAELRRGFAVDAGRNVGEDVREVLERFARERLLEPPDGER